MEKRPGAIWFAKHPRLGGFIFLTFSWGVASWAYFGFLESAKTGRPMIAISMGFSGLVSFGILGLISFVGGTRAAVAIQGLGKGPKDFKYYAFLALVIAPGLLAYAWLRYQLAQLGYD